MMKVLYVDRWVKGIHNFKFFDKLLKNSGFDTMLLHYSSLYNIECKKEEIIDGILCKDISSYNTIFIYKAILKIKPVCIIGLTTVYLHDRIIINIAQYMGIKTIYLQHGDRALGSVLPTFFEMSNYKNKFVNKFKKIGLYHKIFFNYFVILLKFNFKRIINFYFLKVLINLFNNPVQSYVYPNPNKDVIYDLALLYSKKYIDYIVKVGYRSDQVKVVGNPNMDEVIRRVNKINKIKLNPPKEILKLINANKKYCLYLENSYAAIGVWSYDYLNNHLMRIRDKLKQKNIELIIKLHPLTNINQISIEDCIICRNEDILTLSYFSEFCIIHSSSINNVPILLKKPLLFPKWGLSKNVMDYYLDYPGLVNYWDDYAKDFKLIVDSLKYEKYIEDNLYLTGCAAENITKEILSLVQN